MTYIVSGGALNSTHSLHSGRTEACLVTALADQPAECYHNQVVTVPVQPSGIAVLSQRQLVECS